jgi:hypothetical protein
MTIDGPELPESKSMAGRVPQFAAIDVPELVDSQPAAVDDSANVGELCTSGNNASTRVL